MSKITTTVRINENIKRDIEKLAKEQNRSFSNFVETILTWYLKEKGEQSRGNEKIHESL